MEIPEAALLSVNLSGGIGGAGGSATTTGGTGGTGEGASLRVVDQLFSHSQPIFHRPQVNLIFSITTSTNSHGPTLFRDVLRSLPKQAGISTAGGRENSMPVNGDARSNTDHWLVIPAWPSFFPISAICLSIGLEMPQSLSNEILGLTILSLAGLTLFSLRWAPGRGRRHFLP
ncbi:hypothetical protein R3P38DRAFT_174998 [Favolaschia claudopus]|uniref:Uncharacterized protein n=1 Tax=Favolaschia claudopus TaxID=2862362 RepID=A0AAW0D1N8_9AGAR